MTTRKNNKGFTLAELLIVVAIVGVLVAISIPIFSGKLEKAKIATNQANIRSAKAAAIADYLTSGETTEHFYEYDIDQGAIVQNSNKEIYKKAKVENGIFKQIYISINYSDLTEIYVKTLPYFTEGKFRDHYGSTTKAKKTENNSAGRVQTQDTGALVLD